jgi:hypothetical protein
LEASVNGMLHERMTYGGWGAGVGIGRFSFGFNRGKGEGTATVNLGVQGTIREDMTNESFTAVLERIGPDGHDVVRLIVPSASSVRDYVRNLIWDWQRSLQVNSRSELAVRTQLDAIADRLVCDASYVADRLGAIGRMDPSKLLPIAVVGTTVNEHSLLAGGIQFGPDGHWYQLFPIALINAIADLMNGRTPPPTPPAPSGLEAPDGDSSAQAAPSAAASSASDGHLQVSAELQSARESVSRLSVATIGHFGLTVGDDDLTVISNKSRSPVSFGFTRWHGRFVIPKTLPAVPPSPTRCSRTLTRNSSGPASGSASVICRALSLRPSADVWSRTVRESGSI